MTDRGHPSAPTEIVALPGDLARQFQVERLLGEGGQGRTYLGRAEDGSSVAIKVLEVPDIARWKDLELFEREIMVLRQLDHSGIPKVIASHADTESGALYMVREYVDGEPLSDLLDRDETLEAGEARRFLVEMLAILEYLHTLLPPVVHRDIKPQNIIRRADGTHALIDFGAASATARLTGGSTFVGTNGYMPAEQLMGRADIRSDLYALGATTVQLMSGHHPSNLIGVGMRMRTDVLPDETDGLRSVLERLVEPVPEKRYQSPKRVREILEGGSAMVLAVESAGSLTVTRTADELKIELPPLHRVQGMILVGLCLFYAATSSGVRGTALQLALAALAGIVHIILRAFQKRTLRLTNNELIYTRAFLGRVTKTVRLQLTDVVDSSRVGVAKYGDLMTVMTRDGKRHRLGFSVPQQDLDWIMSQIKIWKEEHAP